MLAALGAGALAAPIMASAQQQKLYRIGFVGADYATEPQKGDVFVLELAKQGFVVGANLAIESRGLQKDGTRFPLQPQRASATTGRWFDWVAS